MAILTAPGVHPSLAMGLERKTAIMLSFVIATDHTLLYFDILYLILLYFDHTLLYFDISEIHRMNNTDDTLPPFTEGEGQCIAELTMSDRASDIFEL